MNAQPHHYRLQPEDELTRVLAKAKADKQPVIIETSDARYRVVHDTATGEQTDTADQVQQAKSNLRKYFGSVTPHNHPEDFAALRQEFEEGVAADALTRGQHEV